MALITQNTLFDDEYGACRLLYFSVRGLLGQRILSLIRMRRIPKFFSVTLLANRHLFEGWMTSYLFLHQHFYEIFLRPLRLLRP